jgi:hypothetical protein
MKRYGWMAALGSLIGLVLLAAAGYLVFQAGVAQGAAGDGATGFFIAPGLLPGILGVLVIFMFAKIVLRMIFFPFFAIGMGRRFGHWGHRPGRWGMDEDRPVPPFFQAWHEHAHAIPEEEAEQPSQG